MSALESWLVVLAVAAVMGLYFIFAMNVIDWFVDRWVAPWIRRRTERHYDEEKELWGP